MPHPGRNNIYEATIKRMVNEALEAQEQEFACNRGNDSDEQLLGYLCFCASLLGHTPWPREIVGGSMIEARFGSWETALANAKLPMPTTLNLRFPRKHFYISHRRTTRLPSYLRDKSSYSTCTYAGDCFHLPA